jgi:predicted LPLAT superfamily acyltransferase
VPLQVIFEKSVSGFSDPVQENPYDGLPAESGAHPLTVASTLQVPVAVVVSVKQQ